MGAVLKIAGDDEFWVLKPETCNGITRINPSQGLGCEWRMHVRIRKSPASLHPLVEIVIAPGRVVTPCLGCR